jgi:hypothetical protein
MTNCHVSLNLNIGPVMRQIIVNRYPADAPVVLRDVLVWCLRSSQHTLIVIPGKLARPGIQDFQSLLDAGFHRHDGKTQMTY